MIDQSGRHDLVPAKDESSEELIARVAPGRDLSPFARTLVISSVVFATWTGLFVVLVVVNAINPVPALVLVVLAFIVLAVEVERSRLSSRNRFGNPPEGVIAPVDMQSLLEIEQASLAEERRALIARELSRLAAVALRPDPTQRASWPTPEQFAALRDQIALLSASATDSRIQQLPVGTPVGHLTDADLTSAIHVLDAYVAHLSRMQRLDVHDREQTRILVRDQRQLQAVQDTIVGLLQEPAIPPSIE
ncbi:MAG TPA: hypothetical protein VNE17_05260 [Nitrolancea sp.]|nr:hypothetical protein [Nitrolancea sp.]